VSPGNGIAVVAVDWGTSHLRVWTIGSDGAVLAERKSDDGMSSTARDRFESVLETHLQALSVPDTVPVIMCGMVGSRQGWVEAGYLPVPATLDQIAESAVRAPSVRRDIRILPGLSRPDREAPDVMRGEETQLLGLARTAPLPPDVTRIVCMPGTHSKWVHKTGLRVEDFASFITGDMFSVLSKHSVLRHSIGEEAVGPGSAEFLDAVGASLRSPADFLARVFSIRPAGLLHDLSPADARARLSGFLIGQEIAGVRSRLPVGATVDLVGGGALGALYRAALSVAGIRCTEYDADSLVIAGLTEAASVIWQVGLAKAG
jgi:2-dehydro-3-deoxygalactonokinase